MNTGTISRKSGLAALSSTLFGTQADRALGDAEARDAVLDIDRFIGEWHVIAAIPGDREKAVYQPIMRYELTDSGTINTSFIFRKGGFDGPRTCIKTRGLKRDPSNATWHRPFCWPFTSTHRVLFVNEDYTQAIVSREKDSVWIISRDAELSCADFFACAQEVRERGYDTRKLAFMRQTRRP
jgi:apolipoprotein D and lipocalin family protein